MGCGSLKKGTLAEVPRNVRSNRLLTTDFAFGFCLETPTINQTIRFQCAIPCPSYSTLVFCSSTNVIFAFG